jgi:(p)ppGpp synthase/HD superfamily hydrolase
MSKLEEAILLAVQAHRGQTDKAGRPYILHPLRMMTKMRTEAEMMAAVLHDVVEDTDWSIERLRAQGFPEEVLLAVECLTKREGEEYMAFIERAKANPVARRVKLADLEDNMDVRRIQDFTAKDAERVAKYNRAWRLLVEPENA